MNTKVIAKVSPSRIFFCNELLDIINKYFPCVDMRLNSTCQCCLNFIFNKTGMDVQLYLCNIFNENHRLFIRKIIFDELITSLTKDNKNTRDMLFSGKYVMSYCDGNNILTLRYSKKKNRGFIIKVYFPKDTFIKCLKQIQSKIA